MVLYCAAPTLGIPYSPIAWCPWPHPVPYHHLNPFCNLTPILLCPPCPSTDPERKTTIWVAVIQQWYRQTEHSSSTWQEGKGLRSTKPWENALCRLPYSCSNTRWQCSALSALQRLPLMRDFQSSSCCLVVFFFRPLSFYGLYRQSFLALGFFFFYDLSLNLHTVGKPSHTASARYQNNVQKRSRSENWSGGQE